MMWCRMWNQECKKDCSFVICGVCRFREIRPSTPTTQSEESKNES